MDPATIAILIRVLVMYGPAAYKAVVELFHKDAPTKEDFMGLLDYAQQKSYDDYVAGRPAGGPTP